MNLRSKIIRRGRFLLGQMKRGWAGLFQPPPLFREVYSAEDFTTVTLYSETDSIFAGYAPRTDPFRAARRKRVKVSLVATMKDETATIDAWMAALIHQSRLPDEIVVVDTGSRDGSVEQLQKWAGKSGLPVRIYCLPEENISAGRNYGIRQAQYDVLAVTDLGTRAHPDWLERLIAPFEIDPEVEVSGGWYRAVGADGNPLQSHYWQRSMGNDPQAINPPGANIAFTRQAWQKAGGFPEWLALAGEDSYFDQELRRVTACWAFSPQALVDWNAPGTFLAHCRKIAHWSGGDGESGLHAPYYWRAVQKLGFTLLAGLLGLGGLLAGLLTGKAGWAVGGLLAWGLWLAAVLFTGRRAGYPLRESCGHAGHILAQAIGYLHGARRRQAATLRRLSRAERIFLILAGVPIDDTGGGSRFAQFAREMIRQQNVVVYLHQFDKGETIDLNMRIRHPNLFHERIDRFDLKEFCERYALDLKRHRVAGLVEVPLAGWLPLLQQIKQAGGQVLYDLLDDWNSSLGARWYSQPVEQEIIDRSDHLLATAPVLAQRLERLSGRPVTLLPNAVNARLFNPRRHYPAPVDWPATGRALIYTGALYGDWFDWNLLVRIAERFPQTAVMVIGDYRGECPKKLPNLHFLGLKRQNDLPAYLAHAGAAIIPWKNSAVTQATSPLKVYEYLAMHLPVVAPDLSSLRGLPGVLLAGDHEDFLHQISLSCNFSLDINEIDKFVYNNCWEKRVRDLTRLLDKPIDPVE